MDSIIHWVKYLNDPLILSGFVLFIFSSLLKVLKTENINQERTHDLMDKGLNFIFILSVLIIISGLIKMGKNTILVLILGLCVIVLGLGVKWNRKKNKYFIKSNSIEQKITGASGILTQAGNNANVNTNADPVKTNIATQAVGNVSVNKKQLNPYQENNKGNRKKPIVIKQTIESEESIIDDTKKK